MCMRVAVSLSLLHTGTHKHTTRDLRCSIAFVCVLLSLSVIHTRHTETYHEGLEVVGNVLAQFALESSGEVGEGSPACWSRYVYTYTYIYTYMYIHMYIHIDIDTSIYIHTYLFIYI